MLQWQMLAELMRRQAKELLFCALLGSCLTRVGWWQIICLFMNFFILEKPELEEKEQQGEKMGKSNEK